MDTNTIDTVQTTTKIKRAYIPTKIELVVSYTKRQVRLTTVQKKQCKIYVVTVGRKIRIEYDTLKDAEASYKAHRIEAAVIHYFDKLGISLSNDELRALGAEAQKWQGEIVDCVAIMINLLEQLLTKKRVLVKH